MGSELVKEWIGLATGRPRVSGKARRTARIGIRASGATPPGACGRPGPQGKTPARQC